MNRLLACAMDDAVHLWDLPAGREIPLLSPDLARTACLNPRTGFVDVRNEQLGATMANPTIRHECFGNAARPPRRMICHSSRAALPLTDGADAGHSAARDTGQAPLVMNLALTIPAQHFGQSSTGRLCST